MTTPTWKDAKSRDWQCVITVAEIRRAKELAGIDLLKVFDGEMLMQLAEDPLALSSTMWAISKNQADASSISRDSFDEGFVGDAIEAAGTALIEGLINFFPKSRRDVLRRAWDKTRSSQTAVLEMAGQKLESPQMDGAIERILSNASEEIDRQLNELGKPSTSSPAS